MAYWLLKSEPATFSWRQMQAKPLEEWHGVRNYTARNNMRAMQVDDLCFFYHSVQEKQVMGIVRVKNRAHPDSTAELRDGKVVWDCVDVVPELALPRPVTLEAIRAEPRLAGMVLVNNSRLSVQPVSEADWRLVCEMGGVPDLPRCERGPSNDRPTGTT